MIQFKITKGDRTVIVTGQDGRYRARLYVNGGETATLQNWKGKTEAGARKWTAKVLSD